MEEHSLVARALTREGARVYAGKYTQYNLIQVERGQETLPTLRRERRMYCGLGDVALSLDETIRLLEQRQGVQKTTEELVAEMQRYQRGLSDVEREPDAYVAPEAAHAWYVQQVQRVGEQLQWRKLGSQNSDLADRPQAIYPNAFRC